VWNGPQPIMRAINTGENAENSGHGARFRRIDTKKTRVRMGLAQHHSVGLPRDIEIVAESALPHEQPVILLPEQGVVDHVSCAHFLRGDPASGYRSDVSIVSLQDKAGGRS
jgi:hypothetical protein